MLKHKRLLLASILLIVAVAFILPRTQFLNISSRIKIDRLESISFCAVDLNNRVYILGYDSRNPMIEIHDSHGVLVKSLMLPQYSAYKEALLRCLCGGADCITRVEPGSGNGTILLTIDRELALQQSTLDINYDILTYHTYIDSVVMFKNVIYLVGVRHFDGYVRSLVTAFSDTGKSMWDINGKTSASYNHTMVDKNGYLIAAGDIYEDQGPVVAKYSAKGDLMWQHKYPVDDGGTTVWLGLGKNDTVYTIARLHNEIVLKNVAEEFFYGLFYGPIESSGMDYSGRKQDYLLTVYSKEGKVLRKKVLSHGTKLHIVSAVMDKGGDIIAVGNRKDGNAQIVRFDSYGNKLWSGAVKLPRGCYVKGLVLNGNGSIYIYGDSRNYSNKNESRTPRPFVYKITHGSRT